MWVSLGSISLRVGPLCTGLMSVCWVVGSRQSYTVPLGLITSTKLLHHFIVSFTSNGTIIFCFVGALTPVLKALAVHIPNALVGFGMLSSIFYLQWKRAFKALSGWENTIKFLMCWLCYFGTCFLICLFVWSCNEIAYSMFSLAIGSYIILQIFVYTGFILCGMLINVTALLAWVYYFAIHTYDFQCFNVWHL